MQVSTLSAQFRLRSGLVDWYRDSTSVPYDHFLIDLSPRTEVRLRYRTNTGSIPSKFYIPGWLKQSELLDDEHSNSLYSPSVLIILRQKQCLFLQFYPEEFIRFLCECNVNVLKGNLQSMKRHQVTKFQN